MSRKNDSDKRDPSLDEAGGDGSSGKLDFDQLWQALAPHVRAAVSRHRSRDVALAADDLMQEVRIRLWKVYSGDRNSRLKTSYYYRVVNSAIVDSLRSHRGTLAHSVRSESDAGEDEPALIERIGGEEPGPDRVFDEQHRKARLLQAIRQLPADRGRAVTLYLQGFSVPEIAELLGCDQNRAHNLAYRGVRALKESMGDAEDSNG